LFVSNVDGFLPEGASGGGVQDVLEELVVEAGDLGGRGIHALQIDDLQLSDLVEQGLAALLGVHASALAVNPEKHGNSGRKRNAIYALLPELVVLPVVVGVDTLALEGLLDAEG